MSHSPTADAPAAPAQPATHELHDADLDLAVGGTDPPQPDLRRQEQRDKRSATA